MNKSFSFIAIIFVAASCRNFQLAEKKHASYEETIYHETPLTIKKRKKKLEFKFPLNSSSEHIYGISYEVRGELGSSAAPVNYDIVASDGKKTLENIWINNHYGSFRVYASPNWQKGQVEIFTKKGSKELILRIAALNSSETGSIQIRNIAIKEGGFPQNPPVKGAPYLSWIESLQANRDYAKKNPLLYISDKNRAGILATWTCDIQLPSELSENKRFSDIKLLKKQVQPFLNVSAKKLIELMPDRRPFTFGTFNYFHYLPARYEQRKLKWSPESPNILRKQDNSIFLPEKEYPITGYSDTVAFSGKKDRYPYHDSTGNKSDLHFLKDRVYLDEFMTTARINELCRAAYVLAALYRKTGNEEYGERSAAILYAWANTVKDWPIYGSPNNAARVKAKFWPPDTYGQWFAFITGLWYCEYMKWLRWPARNYDLLRDTPVWSKLSKTLNKDAQKTIENGWFFCALFRSEADTRNNRPPCAVKGNPA